MTSINRIIVNTLVQYSRAIINVILSLFSTRLIISALGVEDYGVYVVVGGLVALLGFITNALVITTQRYISFYSVCEDSKFLGKVFANSLLVHLVFAISIVVLLLAVRGVMINDILTIASNRLQSASVVYVFTVAILFVTIMISPFKAIFIARENIIYLSIVEIIDAFLKLFVAIYVSLSVSDKLILYSELMTFIQLFNLAALTIYGFMKFEECRFEIKTVQVDFKIIKGLVGFAGWTTYGMGAVVARTQGIQIMINHFFGTILNAAFGVALQLYGAISFVSTSILNAMNPQIMRAEGAGDRKLMLKIASYESKYSTMLLMFFAIPMIFEIDNILSSWLEIVPQNAGMFCRFILISFVIDQATYGLNTANQATGNVRNYVLLMYTPKLLVVVVVWALLRCGGTSTMVMIAYVASELLVSIARIPYLKYTCGMSVLNYVKMVFLPLLPLLAVQCLTCTSLTYFVSIQYRFILTFVLSAFLGGIVVWVCSMSKEEKEFVNQLLLKRLKR